jgi:hypothetical protein
VPSFDGLEPPVGLAGPAIGGSQRDSLRLIEEGEEQDTVAERQEHEYHDREWQENPGT